MPSDFFYCPNPDCPNHSPLSDNNGWYEKHGTHPTKAFGNVQRYRCTECGRTFSDQTFSLNYYLKKQTDFKALFKQLNSNNSDCFIGRDVGLSVDSVQLRRERLARNGMFFQQKVLENIRINESLAADGFESYTKSKFYPTNINIMVGSESLFLYYLTESLQRRKGVMTKRQKKRAESEYANKSFKDSRLHSKFGVLLEYLKGRTVGQSITLFTDEHKTYKRVIDKINSSKPGKAQSGLPRIKHIQISSLLIRDKNNPLHPVNYHDRQIRKDIANHRRKTICHARNDRCMLTRMIMYMVSHNFFKPFEITSRRNQTAARHYDALGIDQRKLAYWKSVLFTKRFIQSRVKLPEYFKDIWFKRTATPLKEGRDYVPGFAFQ